MTAEELANSVERVIRETRQRVLGVGKEQYSSEEGQLFERIPVSELQVMAREEALDLVVYGVMLAVRLERLETMLLTVEAGGGGGDVAVEGEPSA